MNSKTFFLIVTQVVATVDYCLSIVGGGIEASPNEFPWAVRLEGCGGALVSHRHIITAAHCLTRYDPKIRTTAPAHPDNIWIYLGGHAGPHVRETSGLYLSKIKDILLPFNNRKISRTLNWDLALIEIDPINFTSTIKAIKIAPSRPPTGETVTLAGWGFLNRSKPAHALHKIELQVLEDCDYYYSITGRFCARHPNAENELKVINENDDACIGDSGSPLMVKQKEVGDDEWRLTGVMTAGYTSVGEDCEKLGGYSTYADLSHPPIKAWLSKAIGEDVFQNDNTHEFTLLQILGLLLRNLEVEPENFNHFFNRRNIHITKISGKMTYQVNKDKMNLIFNALLLHARDTNRRPSVNFPLKQELIDDLIDASIFTFMSEPILLEVGPPIAIFGDIHGQFDDLVGWFDFVDWPPNRRCLFLGDYVDRGDYSLEVACFLMVLKVLYPREVYLLRGNHEATIINKSYGFLEECKNRLSSDQNRFYRRFNHAFACMPMAAIVGDQILCMHGGLSPALMSMEQVKRVRRPVDIIDYGLLCDLCWSDPDPNLREKFAESLRGAGHRFSRDVVKEFCTKMNFTFIARAHQVPESENGFEFTFGSYKDKIMTIFSAPAYMRRMNEAACMLIDEKMKCNFKVLKPKAHDKAHVGA